MMTPNFNTWLALAVALDAIILALGVLVGLRSRSSRISSGTLQTRRDSDHHVRRRR